jgi:hypothetical protein
MKESRPSTRSARGGRWLHRRITCDFGPQLRSHNRQDCAGLPCGRLARTRARMGLRKELTHLRAISDRTRVMGIWLWAQG